MRHRHLPLHRHRGIDAPDRGARGGRLRRCARGAPPAAASRLRRPRRGRGRHAGRRVPLRLRESCCGGGRGRGRAAGARPAPGHGADGPAHGRAAAHGRGLCGARAAPSGTDRRQWARRPGRGLVGHSVTRRRRPHRPRRAPSEGLRRAGRALPARRRTLSAAEDDLEHEPAPACLLLRRQGGGAGGAPRPASERQAPRHPLGPGRDGQDATRGRGRHRARARLRGRRVLDRPRDATRRVPGHRDDGPDAWRKGRARRVHRRARVAAPPRQLRAGRGRRARSRAAARALPEAEAARHQPRGAADRR